MTEYLLDTNIISNATKPRPSESLAAWLSAQMNDTLYIASLSLAEIWRGVLEKPQGRKRTELEAWFHGDEGPQMLFAGRILTFDTSASLIWAHLMAEGTASGRTRNPMDTIIAAVAVRNGCVVVTDNERHFWGLNVFNPLTGYVGTE